jgi:TonB family protein
MDTLGYGVGAHKARIALGSIAGTVLMALACTASAQTAGGTSIDEAPSEAARRAALSPYRFILQNSTAPARKPTPAAKPAPEPAPVAETRRPAPPPVRQATAEPSAQPPASATAKATPPASAPASEAALASLSPQHAEPPPPRLEIIPVRTDEPRLPPALLREQPHGIVRVSFEIEPDGSVGEVKIVSSTNRALNRPTVDAVKGWKFQPVDAVLTVETELDYKIDN